MRLKVDLEKASEILWEQKPPEKDMFQPKCRMLKRSELIGISKLPVSLTQCFITDTGFKSLSQAGFEIEGQTLKSGSVMGIHTSLPMYMRRKIIDVLALAVTLYGKELGMFLEAKGDLFKTDDHYYALVLPQDPHIQIYGWSLNVSLNSFMKEKNHGKQKIV